MRQLLHAMILATVVAVVLVVGAQAASDLATHGDAAHEPGPAAALDAQSTATQRPTLYARVVKAFGAAVRILPSSDAAIMFSAECGEVWPVQAVEGGWVKVRTEGGPGWIGGSRVVVSSAPPAADCSEARHIYPTGAAWTYVPTGCLSLRSRAGADAPILSCVANGHNYAVLDGPFDPGSGDDWFRVSSASTGSGWVLAKHLYPS